MVISPIEMAQDLIGISRKTGLLPLDNFSHNFSSQWPQRALSATRENA